MPADALTISLTGPLADDLRAAADACDMSVEDYVRTVLARAADAAEALGWNESIDEDIDAAKDFEETEMGIPAEEVFAEIRARLAARIPAKQK